MTRIDGEEIECPECDSRYVEVDISDNSFIECITCGNTARNYRHSLLDFMDRVKV